ncbi:uncharacterized protein LOC143210058 isoform X2 [Lasioglossum baleicum]|uniref:uncharacterized protein LOC143210058 isoform X2 n=1 Tax=Lasioglossum baleicum TaxID=434251 RepID=UPI003FCDA315
MADFLNIGFLTFLCVTVLGVLEARANTLVPDQELKLRNNDGRDVNINAVFDDVMPVIKDLIIKKGLDPLKMRDVQKELHGILDKSGVLNLSHGWAQGLSQLKRSGDVVVSYKDKIVTLDAMVGLDLIDVGYDYKFKYSIISRSGALNARLSDTKVRVVLKVDLKHYRLSLVSFQTTSVRKIDANLQGGAVDKILSAATNTFIGSFRRQIIETVENRGSEISREYLERINEKIPRPDGTPQLLELEDSAVVRNNNDWENMVDNIPTHVKFSFFFFQLFI